MRKLNKHTKKLRENLSKIYDDCIKEIKNIEEYNEQKVQDIINEYSHKVYKEIPDENDRADILWYDCLYGARLSEWSGQPAIDVKLHWIDWDTIKRVWEDTFWDVTNTQVEILCDDIKEETWEVVSQTWRSWWRLYLDDDNRYSRENASYYNLEDIRFNNKKEAIEWVERHKKEALWIIDDSLDYQIVATMIRDAHEHFVENIKEFFTTYHLPPWLTEKY